MFDLQILNPITYPGWDDLVLSHPEGSFFHASAWAKTLSESYGYLPKYFTVIKENQLAALLPVMEVNSLFTGKRGVSLPFTDLCDPILDPSLPFDHLLDFVVRAGKRAGWRSIELRTGCQFLLQNHPAILYLRHELRLEKDEQKLLSTFRDSTRRNIRKAAGEGVKVRMVNTEEGVEGFFRLNSLTRKEHGLPPQPFFFFEKVREHILSKSLGHLFMAEHGGKKIAASVFFHFNGRAYYKYGASDKGAQHLRANNLVMWEAVRWYAANGSESLCMGRTEPGHQGLLQFKSGWGAVPKSLRYFRYDIRKGAFVPSVSKVTGFHNKIFRNMPIPVLNRIGSILYRHAG